MKRFSAFCFTSRISKFHSHRKHNQSQIMAGNISDPSGSKGANILLNHDFSSGLSSWHLNSCSGYVISAETGAQGGNSMQLSANYAVITDRKKCWQGLEQDITDRISTGYTYSVLACVGVSRLSQGSSDVLATLKLEYHDSATSYLFIGRTSVNKDSWQKLEGTFSLSTKPDRVVFYLEGPAPGVDLLIRSVEINCSTPNNNVCYVLARLHPSCIFYKTSGRIFSWIQFVQALLNVLARLHPSLLKER